VNVKLTFVYSRTRSTARTSYCQFLEAFRRFIAHRRRLSIVYSNNEEKFYEDRKSATKNRRESFDIALL